MVADGFMRQFQAPTPGGLCATEHIFHPSCATSVADAWDAECFSLDAASGTPQVILQFDCGRRAEDLAERDCSRRLDRGGRTAALHRAEFFRLGAAWLNQGVAFCTALRQLSHVSLLQLGYPSRASRWCVQTPVTGSKRATCCRGRGAEPRRQWRRVIAHIGHKKRV